MTWLHSVSAYTRRVDESVLPIGPSPDEPEPAVPGAIEDLLRRVPSDDEYQRRAFALLQRYRGEALAAVTRCTDLGGRRHAVHEAQAALRERLLALLSEVAPPAEPETTADPAALKARLVDPDLVRAEREYRAAYEREVDEARQRLHSTYTGLLSHETWLHTLDGMSAIAAEAAVRANLALRLRGMEEELQALTTYHEDRYLKRLRELAALQEDRRTEGNG
jgi:hypothetical protein